MAMAYLAWQAGGALACGTGLFLWRAGAPPAGLGPDLRGLWRGCAALCLLAALSGAGVVHGEALRILGRAPGWDAQAWVSLLGATRLGQAWCAKQALLLLVAVIAVLAPRRAPPLVAALGAAFLGIGTWAGHGGAAAPVVLVLPLHALHAVLAGAWVGALPVWAWLLWRDEAACPPRFLGGAVQAFSRFATLAMALLVASGLIIAWRQFGTWPALFGTWPGALLALKLTLLALALVAAWRLRRRHLAALVAASTRAVRHAALRVFACEAAAAAGVFAAALQLSRHAPGAHEAVHWWLPFRLALDRSVAAPGHALALAVGVAACALPLAWRGHRRSALVAGLAGAGVIAAVSAVPAYRDTYARSSEPYAVPSIVRGAAHFARHCARCHGAGARGDGQPLAPGLAPPADLARHTGLHTAGDMYQWIGEGVGNGMPGFATVLSVQARWDLVNFLRAVADGQGARLLATAIEPERAWLAPPDFAYTTAAGANATLADSREREALLLVFAGTPSARLATLAAARVTLADAGLAVLIVPGRSGCAAGELAQLACVAGDVSALRQAYGLYTRTLARPGPREALTPALGEGEFLIDRHGYLRARWLPADDAAPWQPGHLVALVAALAAEPEISPPPATHLH